MGLLARAVARKPLKCLGFSPRVAEVGPALFLRGGGLIRSENMLGEVVIESSRMSLWYHPEGRIVHHKMHQYPGQEVLQTVLLRGLELLKEHNACCWLSDDRAGGALPRSHHEWGDRVWAPQAIAAGWRFWALLPPAQALGQANMTRLVEAYGRRGVVVEIFSDLAKAHLWLKRQMEGAGGALAADQDAKTGESGHR